MRCSIRNFFWGESSREQKCNNNLHLTNLWVDSVCFLLSIVMLFMKASFGSLVVLVILWYWGPDKFLTYRYVMCKKGNHVLLYNFYLNGTYTNFLQMPHRIEMTLNIVWLFLENQSSNKLSERNYVGLKLSSKKISFEKSHLIIFFLVSKEYKTNRGTRILSGDPISINSTMSNDSVIGEGEGSWHCVYSMLFVGYVFPNTLSEIFRFSWEKGWKFGVFQNSAGLSATSSTLFLSSKTCCKKK